MKVKLLLSFICVTIMFSTYSALAVGGGVLFLGVNNNTNEEMSFKFIDDKGEVIWAPPQSFHPNTGFGINLTSETFEGYNTIILKCISEDNDSDEIYNSLKIDKLVPKHDKDFAYAAFAFEKQKGWMINAQSRIGECQAIVYDVLLSDTKSNGAWDDNLYGYKLWMDQGEIKGVPVMLRIQGCDNGWGFDEWVWDRDVCLNKIQLKLKDKN